MELWQILIISTMWIPLFWYFASKEEIAPYYEGSFILLLPSAVAAGIVTSAPTATLQLILRLNGFYFIIMVVAIVSTVLMKRELLRRKCEQVFSRFA